MQVILLRAGAVAGRLAVVACLALAGCASAPPKVGGTPPTRSSGATIDPGRDGPEASPPSGLERVPDAAPRLESIRSGGPNKPYEILGREYVPFTQDRAFRERGLASWYGRKFQGRPTASGEIYDMYAMTAAHPTLPIPSYARVRNPGNGREIVVRVNDRGPFHPGRIIDLSYTAALKLDLLRGVAPVELERITYDEIRAGTWQRGNVGNGVQVAAREPASAPLVRIGAVPTDVREATGEARDAAPTMVRGDARAVPSPPDSGDALAGAAANASTVPATGAASTEAVPVAESSATAPGAGSPVATAVAGSMAAASIASSSVAAPVAASRTAAPIAAPLAASVSAAPPREAAAPSAEGPNAQAFTKPARGFWIQLGAFRQRDGATALQRRIGDELAGLAPLLAVFDEAPLFRLQAGPYASRDDARGAAESIRAALQLVTVIVERR